MRVLFITLILAFGLSFDPLNNPNTASNVGFSYIGTHVCEEMLNWNPVASFLVTQGLGLLWESRQKVMDADDLLANLLGYASYRFVVTIKF